MMWKEIVVFILFISLSQQQIFPQLPSTFTSGVEFTIVNKNFTGSLWEYYDTPNDRFRFDTFVGGVYTSNYYVPLIGGGSVKYYVKDTFCNVTNYNTSTALNQVKSPNFYNTLYYYNLASNASYIGKQTVRNISCDYWLASISNAAYNYTVAYYFTSNNWTFVSSNTTFNSTPVRIEVNGTYNGTRRFYHIYDYFLFNADSISSTLFTLNSNLKCGYFTNPLHPTLNNTYKAKVEKTDYINNVTIYYEEWNDHVKNRFITQYFGKDFDTILLGDYTQGSLYTIQGTNCFVQPLVINYVNYTLYDYLLYANKYNTKYQGKTVVRQMPADKWIATITTPEALYNVEMYYSDQMWNYSGKRAPLRINVNGTFYVEMLDTWFPVSTSFDYVGYDDVKDYENVLFDIPFGLECGNLNNIPIPTLPNQWRGTIGYSDRSKSTTSLYTYWYDYDNNRLRTTVWDGPNFIETFYNFEQRFKYVYTYIDSIGNETCARKSLTDNEFEEYTKKTGFLYTSNQFFKIQPSETYQGVREVRGILCDYWISNQVNFYFNGNNNYVKVHHYFAVQDWDMNMKKVSGAVPVRIVFEGSFYNISGQFPFHLQLEIMEFFTGTDLLTQNIFTPPSSANCPVFVGTNFPSLAQRYYATVQLNHLDVGYLQTYVLYNDVVRGNIRMDYRIDTTKYIVISHKNTGRKYSMITNSSNNYCSIGSIMPEDSFIGNQNVPINIADILALKPSSQFILYLGVHPSRKGIDTEVWSYPIRSTVGSNTFVGSAVWYFTTGYWSIHDNQNYRIPIRIDLQGNLSNTAGVNTYVKQRYDIAGFDSRLVTDTNAYDILPSYNCPNFINPNIINVNNTILTTLQIPISQNDLLIQQNNYINNLTNYLSISSSQVSLLKILGNENNSSSYMVLTITVNNETQRQLIARKLNNITINSKTFISQSNSQNIACFGCKGRCYFGQCLCYPGYTGTDCSKKITVITITRKALIDFSSGIFFICLIMALVGYFTGYNIYKYYGELDLKYQKKIGLIKEEQPPQ